ncbi:MAG: hypothetical protein HRF43_16600, partial [Phycisphaerae bacterium]
PPNTWTPNPPSGWSVDRTGVPGVGNPNVGVEEFEGWNFMSATWWAFTAADQGRSAFTTGTNIVAVADPDEWDDLGNPEALGTFNSFLSTPPIPMGPAGPNTAVLRFRSSWRDEDTQTAVINVSYDGGAPIEVMRWTSQAGPNFHNDATDEVVQVPLFNPLGAQNMVISFGLINATDDWWWAIDDIEVSAQLPGNITVLLTEDFDNLPFGPCVEENCPTTPPPTNVWTKVPPVGWSVDRAGVPGVGDPNEGMEEWEGWTFPLKDWWVFVAGDQDRGQFSKGTGVVAVADPDEWDDKGNPEGIGTFNSHMRTPAIPIGGAAENSLTLKFDSSWRDEGNQTASVSVAYDGGAAVEILRWESQQASPNFHNDNPNETVNIPLNNPAGAASMVITFSMTNAVNNWWWAVDNIVVSDGTSDLFSEDFETVVLGPPVQEAPFPPPSPPAVWTDVPPPGWTLDDTHVVGYDLGVPNTLEDNDGRTEWAGWSFPQVTWWPTVDDQQRSEFKKGKGGIAVADPDEWDDQPHPPGVNPGDELLFDYGYNAFMSTPTINIKGLQPNQLYVAFDSSWKSWDPPFNIGRMTAVIDVSYDGAEPVRVMRWANYPGWQNGAVYPPLGDPDYKPDATNESVLIPLLNPRADTATIRFGLINAGNDWWWAIDHVVVFALNPGSDPSFDLDGDGDVDQADYGLFQPCLDVIVPYTPLSLNSPIECVRADYEPNGFLNQVDLDRFLDCFSGPSIPADPTCDD